MLDASRLFLLRSGSLPQLLAVLQLDSGHVELQEYALSFEQGMRGEEFMGVEDSGDADTSRAAWPLSP